MRLIQGGLGQGEAAVADTADSEDWYAKAYAYDERGDGKRAQEAYATTIQKDPHHVGAMLNLGRILHNRGDLDGAKAWYVRALEVEPYAACAWFNLAVALEDEGDEESAMACYLSAIYHNPLLADAHYNVARLYNKAGVSEKASKHLLEYRKHKSSSDDVESEL